jgi:structural maintenance of chromosome 2
MTSKGKRLADSRYPRFFGKSGTPYDFQDVNLHQARDQCRELETQQKGMGRKINTKVMNMIDK